MSAPQTREHAGAIYRVAAALARVISRFLGTVEIEGKKNIPARGPFLLISNHQSVLDPILTQAFIPRPVFAMAKSTQFSAPGIGPLMPYLNAFPVRRYQIDAQAVRTALRILREGHGVAIYIEGERSWDGELQEPRIGTARLALRAGVPVIPTVVSGTYDAWPRWASTPTRAPIRIRFLPQLQLPCLRGDANRAAAPGTADLIMEMLRAGSLQAGARDSAALRAG